MNLSIKQINRWRIYCDDEKEYIDGYLDINTGIPITCFNNNSHVINSSKTKLIEIINEDYTESVTKWKIYCDTENKNIEGYLNTDDGIPTKCFNNNSHSISNPEQLKIIKNNKFRILEDFTPVQGKYRAETIKLENIQPYSDFILNKTWPVNIAPLCVILMVSDKQKGDSLIVDVAPDQTIGFISQDITSGTSNILNVNDTVLENVYTNFCCTITDGINTENLGCITNVDYKEKTITVENTINNTYLASSPTYIKITATYIGPHEFGETGNIKLGDSKVGSAHIPKNTITRIKYTNTWNIVKNFYMIIEYLY